MKRIIKILIIVEIQVALILMIMLLSKQGVLEAKVFNTNKFVYELLTNKRLEELKEIDNNDIIIGKEYAPVTLYVYARYGCSACRKFFETVYPKLQDEYVRSGELKIVIRQIVHTSRPQILHASIAALYAYKNGWYEEFNESMHTLNGEFSDEVIDGTVIDLVGCSRDEYSQFMNDGANEQILFDKSDGARKAGITAYPTFVIGDEKIVGVRPFVKFQSLIDEELKSESCR